MIKIVVFNCFIRLFPNPGLGLVALVALFSSLAQAGENRITKCILKEVRGTILSHPTYTPLELGTEVVLEIAGSRKPISVSYLALGEGKFGPEYVFYDAQSNTYYHTPWEKLSVTNPGAGKIVHMPLSRHWVAQIAKNSDNKCIVHAASDCAYHLKNVVVNPTGYPNAEAAAERKALFDRAESTFFKSKTLKTSSKYEDFLNDEGITVDVVQAFDPGATDKVSAHLESGKPVFMTYFGRETRFSDKTVVHWENHPPSEKFSLNKKKFRPDVNPDEEAGHAVVALGIFKPKVGEKRVLVLDSSDDGYRVWTWSEFTRSSTSKPSVFYLSDLIKK